MIQATQTKMIDPKALKGAKAVAGEQKGAQALAETLVDGQDFAHELAASLSEGAEGKIAEAAAEQTLDPAALQQQVQSVGEASPKVFDPAMTKGVEKLIQPKTSMVPAQEVQAAPLTDGDVLKLANGDVSEVKAKVAQAMLKTPQVNQQAPQVSYPNIGRSPAIDFAKSEVDPQLMNMEDFVAQKNLATKKALPQGYGLQPKTSLNEAALENGLKATQTVKETSSSDALALGTAAGGAVGSQQFILNMMNEQGAPVEAQATQKIFDMSHIKTENSNQIMNQISDYIVQAKASKEPTVNMKVNHEELGLIDITVSKATGSGQAQDMVAINIGAHSQDGKNFFQQNSKDLFSHLGQAGVNVADLKIETPTQSSKSDFDMNQHNRQNSQGERHFGSEQNQRRHESNRRQELWDLLKDKEAA